MTNEEAIKILQGMNLDLMYPNGEYAVDGLPEDKLKKYLATGKAIEALHRAQPANEPCADCSGIVYRQTASGKIIPADAKCAVIEPPPCYQPDNDGCAYQIYGDNDDEPIDKCKACPLCYSDKVRHNASEPLTLEQLKQMDGEPVWCADGEGHSCYCLVNAESEDCIDSECGAWCFGFYGMTGDGENGLHNMGWLAYAHKPGGEQE